MILNQQYICHRQWPQLFVAQAHHHRQKLAEANHLEEKIVVCYHLLMNVVLIRDAFSDIPLPPDLDDEPLPPGVDVFDVTPHNSKVQLLQFNFLNIFLDTDV